MDEDHGDDDEDRGVHVMGWPAEEHLILARFLNIKSIIIY